MLLPSKSRVNRLCLPEMHHWPGIVFSRADSEDAQKPQLDWGSRLTCDQHAAAAEIVQVSRLQTSS